MWSHQFKRAMSPAVAGRSIAWKPHQLWWPAGRCRLDPWFCLEELWFLTLLIICPCSFFVDLQIFEVVYRGTNRTSGFIFPQFQHPKLKGVIFTHLAPTSVCSLASQLPTQSIKFLEKAEKFMCREWIGSILGKMRFGTCEHIYKQASNSWRSRSISTNCNPNPPSILVVALLRG